MRAVTRSGTATPATWVTVAVLALFLVLTFPLLKLDLSRIGGFAEMLKGMAKSPDWPYLPKVVALLAETLGMAFVATSIALVVGLPLSLLAARNTSLHPAVALVVKTVSSFVRAVPDMVWASMLASAVGLGVLPGILALVIASSAFMVKVFAEIFEVVDPKPVEGVLAHGASPLAVRTFAIVPQAGPDLVGLTLYILDINVRAATILGLVGAGGLGFEITTYLKLQNWERLSLIFVGIFLLVTVIDRVSAGLRKRLVS